MVSALAEMKYYGVDIVNSYAIRKEILYLWQIKQEEIVVTSDCDDSLRDARGCRDEVTCQVCH